MRLYGGMCCVVRVVLFCVVNMIRCFLFPRKNSNRGCSDPDRIVMRSDIKVSFFIQLEKQHKDITNDMSK